MSAISEFTAKQEAFNIRLEEALVNISDDIKGLNELIVKLQSTPGTITPEDQALLDQVQAKAEALTVSAEVIDNLTPPQPPVA